MGKVVPPEYGSNLSIPKIGAALPQEWPLISGPARSWWGAHRPGQWWSLPAARQEDTTLRGILRCCWRNVREVLRYIYIYTNLQLNYTYNYIYLLDIYCDLLVEGHIVLITFTLIFTDICIYTVHIHTGTYTDTYTYTYKYVYVSYVYIYVCVHTYIHTGVYIYIYISLYIYIYIFSI